MSFLSSLLGGGNRSSAEANLNPIGIDMGGIRDAANTERAQQQPFAFESYLPERQGLFNGPRGFLGGIGRIGDALAMAGGRAPVYQQFTQDQDTRSAFGDLATDPTNQSALARLASANPEMAIKFRNAFVPKAVQPHYWETNDGSLGSIGPDGQPRIAYKDPTPKLNWITADNGDGTKQIIPVGPNGPVGGHQPQRPDQPQQPAGATIDAFGARAMRESLGERGYQQWKQRHGVSEIGAATTGKAPASQTIGGRTYYQVNGKWYDNPEGR